MPGEVGPFHPTASAGQADAFFTDFDNRFSFDRNICRENGLGGDNRADIDICTPMINDSLSLGALDTFYNSSDPRAPAGVFTISATFSNVSSDSFVDLFF